MSSSAEKKRFSYEELQQLLAGQFADGLPPRIKRTLRLAFDGHQGQLRASREGKTPMPAIVHPVGTARLAKQYYESVSAALEEEEIVLCVALCHDLLEDTRISPHEIENAAGATVAKYVEALTRPPAGIAGQTSAQRNQAFIQQILEAGPTAVFVKICDSMHNLSRPRATPISLMKKLTTKAQEHYLPMLDICALGPAIKNEYVKALKSAKLLIQEDAKYDPGFAQPKDLESAISECIRAATGKVLELHDLVELAQRVFSAHETVIWTAERGATTLKCVIAKAEDSALREYAPKVSDYCDQPKCYLGTDAERVAQGLVSTSCSTLYTIPVQTKASMTLVFAMAFQTPKPPAWLSLDNATVLIQFLVHRLVVWESDRRSRLAVQAAQLGLQIDIDLAERLGVKAGDLMGLEEWRRHCVLAVSSVKHSIDMFLLRTRNSFPLVSLVRVESRVKTVNSILRKHAAGRDCTWPAFRQMEDIAGVRVIAPTESILLDIERHLISPADSPNVSGFYQSSENPRRDYLKSPTTAGYKALHIVLGVQVRNTEQEWKVIPCEIQLRTMLQDAWAAISHELLYRSSRNARRRAGKTREAIIDLLGRSEDMIAALANETDSGLSAEQEETGKE